MQLMSQLGVWAPAGPDLVNEDSESSLRAAGIQSPGLKQPSSSRAILFFSVFTPQPVDFHRFQTTRKKLPKYKTKCKSPDFSGTSVSRFPEPGFA